MDTKGLLDTVTYTCMCLPASPGIPGRPAAPGNPGLPMGPGSPFGPGAPEKYRYQN